MAKPNRRSVLAAVAGTIVAGSATARATPDDGTHRERGGHTMGVIRVKDVAIGEGVPAIIASLTGADAAAMEVQARTVGGEDAVAVAELRIDYLDAAHDPAAISAVVQAVVGALGGKPLLGTFRSQREGGEKVIDPAGYAQIYEALLATGHVDMVDLELAMLAAPEVAAVRVRAREAGVPVMLSHHDFGGTPPTERMLSILEEEERRGADICKLAVMPKNGGDVIRLLEATYRMRERHPERPLLTMAMGGLGAVSRASGQVFGSALTFGKVGGGSASGQMEAGALKEVMDAFDRTLRDS